jgi:hypothetical protein
MAHAALTHPAHPASFVPHTMPVAFVAGKAPFPPSRLPPLDRERQSQRQCEREAAAEWTARFAGHE